MSNLIITIIAIALVAVAALMGALYAGPAFEAAQTKATVNAWISQNAQELQAAQAFSVNNGGLDVVPMCGLVSGGYLSGWPDFINLQPSAIYGNQTTNGVERGFWTDPSTGYCGQQLRKIIGHNGGFIIQTLFTILTSASGTCTTPYPAGSNFTTAIAANSFPTQLAITFNKSPQANVPTSGLTYYNGVPYENVSWTYISGDAANTSTGCIGSPLAPNPASGGGSTLSDGSGNILIGCYIANGSGPWGNTNMVCQQTF